MRIGVPREVKQDEYRVGMIPAGVEELTRAGHQVFIETGAGLGSGITDEQYAEAGGKIVASAAETYGQADLIVKVKEPQPNEWPLLPRRTVGLHLFSLRRQRRSDEKYPGHRLHEKIAYEKRCGRKAICPASRR
ncbi:MAG: hypothetical protein U0872_02230 [Planctomycetaceae bacterium]